MFHLMFTRVGGMHVDIAGWGNEDVLFYERCMKKGLSVIRSVDPDLVHR